MSPPDQVGWGTQVRSGGWYAGEIRVFRPPQPQTRWGGETPTSPSASKSHYRAQHWQSTWWLKNGRPSHQGPPWPGSEVELGWLSLLAFQCILFIQLSSLREPATPLSHLPPPSPPPPHVAIPLQESGPEANCIILAPCVAQVLSLLAPRTTADFTVWLSVPPVPESSTPGLCWFPHADRRTSLSCPSTQTFPSSHHVPATAQGFPGHVGLYHMGQGERASFIPDSHNLCPP